MHSSKPQSARYVVTMDGGRRVIEDGAVAVRGDRIIGVGTLSDIETMFKARQRIRTPQDALAFAGRFIRLFQGDPLIVPAVAPHARWPTATVPRR